MQINLFSLSSVLYEDLCNQEKEDHDRSLSSSALFRINFSVISAKKITYYTNSLENKVTFTIAAEPEIGMIKAYAVSKMIYSNLHEAFYIFKIIFDRSINHHQNATFHSVCHLGHLDDNYQLEGRFECESEPFIYSFHSANLEIVIKKLACLCQEKWVPNILLQETIYRFASP